MNCQSAPDNALPLDKSIAIFPGVRRDQGANGHGIRQRIALIGGFRPRQCGIATFTTDLYEQLGAHHPEIDIDIYAMQANPSDAPSTDESDLRGVIEEQDRGAYLRTAAAINASGADAVWIQHEYGIFGGPSGEMVLEVIDRVAPPLIVTLHTILADPTPAQRMILDRIVAKASRLMVMSHEGRRLLLEHHGASEQQISLIEHGAPDRPFGRQADQRARLGLADKRIIMTFGLLSRGKGLETAIEALPAIVAEHPDIVYRIVGATHPNLVRHEGEAYRESLVALAKKLGVSDYVVWDNRFLDREELLDQLEACDIYLTPYPNAQQSTSGTLSYAVALGKAVISTPYIHARELLEGEVGLLVPARDPEAIAAAANHLLGSPENLLRFQKRAFARGRTTVWRHFADAAAALVTRAATPAERRPSAHIAMPPRRISHDGLRLMTDDTGMFQHSIGPIPDRRHGYCLDDNARALMLINRATSMPQAERVKYAFTYSSFLQHAWNDDLKGFRNFMAYDRQWCEDLGSEDSNGRAIWTFGDTVARGVTRELRAWALEWFSRTAPTALHLRSPRTIGFSMLGAAAVLDSGADNAMARQMLERGGEILVKLLDAVRRPDWLWFETLLSYDNPRLPDALIQAGRILGKEDWIASGLDALRWICAHQTGETGNFRPVGSDGFGRQHDSLPFDQQPLEAWAAIDACRTAFAIDRGSEWREHAEIAWSWYVGRNDRSIVLGDVATGFCRDGITSRGANENRGAESLLAFQLAYHGLMGILTQDEGHDAGTNGDQVRADSVNLHPA